MLLVGCSEDDDNWLAYAALMNNNTSQETPKFWGAAELVENDDSADVANYDIAISADGTAMAVWRRSGDNKIFASSFNGDDWAPYELIDNVGSVVDPSGGDIKVVMGAHGEAFVVWSKNAGIGQPFQLWGNVFDGTSWLGIKRIDNEDLGSATYPQMDIDGSGNVMVVWQQSDGTRENIWVNRYSAASWSGGVAGDAQKIESIDSEACAANIAMNRDGSAMAVFKVDGGGSVYDVYARYYDGTAWDAAPQQIENIAGDSSEPEVAIDAAGRAVVVWAQEEAKDNLYANYFDGTNWDASPTLLENDDVLGAAVPKVAMDADGNAMVVWWQTNGTNINHIWARGFDGTDWGAAVELKDESAQIGGDSNLYAIFPEVDVDSFGNFIAVYAYVKDDFSAMLPYSVRYTRVGGWSACEPIGTAGAPSFPNSSISVSPDGHAVAAWGQAVGGNASVYANYYSE